MQTAELHPLPAEDHGPEPLPAAMPSAGRLSRAHLAAGVSFLLAFALGFVHLRLAAIPLAIFVVLCFTAPFFPGWSFFLPILSAGPRSHGAVTLTFDDGPDPLTTLPLLDLLARYGVKAAFFVVGERAEAHPRLIREILARGHEIGNHSHSHDLFLMLRRSATLHREVSACQETLSRQGVRSLVFRPPLGMTNSRLPRVLHRFGLVAVGFACRPLDFGNRRVKGLGHRVLRTVERGDVVLLHDCPPRGGVGPWLKEIDTILGGLRERRVEIVPLSVLLGRRVMEKGEPERQAE